ncbi:recombinase family protein [Mitsuokella sp. UBA4253]|uniref:recombinase family protein n=1 Tax=Mitsuokella sp. UBA4253 TaxID=1946959 RepID=UPI00258049F5|nr:recombinase family protein [Mitsuokella sp. UBA4253]
MPRAQKKKAAIYCRVSTLHQVDKDSLPMQRQDMINYAKYVLSIKDYEVFENAGYSGKNTDRPAFQEMMERIERGEFSHVLVWKIDRISRNLLDFATMYARCKKLGVTFVSKNEQFDTSTAMGEAMLKIILVFAELERNMTSERVASTMNARAAEGKWNGGRVPFAYAYDRETDSFSIRDDEAKVALELKDTYLRTHSLTYTARLLNGTGKRTRRGYAWTPATVAIILRSPFYRGTYRYNYRDESDVTFSFKAQNEWILCAKHHPPLFSEADCRQVDYWLDKNRRHHGKATHVQRKHVHIFAGLIQCGVCGSNYAVSVDRARASGYQPSMYNCGGRRQKGTCKNRYVNDITIGGFVFNYISNVIRLRTAFRPQWSLARIQRFLLQDENFREVASLSADTLRRVQSILLGYTVGTAEYQAGQDMRGHGNATAQAREANLRAELERKKRALSRLTHLFLYAEDEMHEADFLREKHSLQDDIASLQDDLAKAEQASVFASSMTDEEFLQKAARLLFQDAMGHGSIDFPGLALHVGKLELKNFINAVIEQIIVLDGRITQLTFRNGEVHTFLYA